MPTLIKLLVVIAVLTAAVWAGMYWLATSVEPQPREMQIRIPAERFDKR